MVMRWLAVCCAARCAWAASGVDNVIVVYVVGGNKFTLPEEGVIKKGQMSVRLRSDDDVTSLEKGMGGDAKELWAVAPVLFSKSLIVEEECFTKTPSLTVEDGHDQAVDGFVAVNCGGESLFSCWSHGGKGRPSFVSVDNTALKLSCVTSNLKKALVGGSALVTAAGAAGGVAYLYHEYLKYKHLYYELIGDGAAATTTNYSAAETGYTTYGGTTTSVNNGHGWWSEGTMCNDEVPAALRGWLFEPFGAKWFWVVESIISFLLDPKFPDEVPGPTVEQLRTFSRAVCDVRSCASGTSRENLEKALETVPTLKSDPCAMAVYLHIKPVSES